MKRYFCLLMILALCLLTACDRQSATVDASTTTPAGDFSPETTAVSGGLTQAVEDQYGEQGEDGQLPEQPETQPAETQPMVQDVAATQSPAASASEAPVVMPFALPTAQPNTAVTSYSEISMPSLGFKFNYPYNWNNLPGRSTVCYVQPMENGTVYPARVAVTMKKLAHKCGPKEAQSELAEYIKILRSQYNEKTFKVETTLDTETTLMGKKGFATSYLAYDGDQEIQGYVILTYFERYLFCYHFLCAYEDYEAFEPTMRYMRDSVQPVQS